MWDIVDVAMDNSSSGTLSKPKRKMKKRHPKKFLIFSEKCFLYLGIDAD